MKFQPAIMAISGRIASFLPDNKSNTKNKPFITNKRGIVRVINPTYGKNSGEM